MPITGKFYARHESNINQGDLNPEYVKLLLASKSQGPKDKSLYPLTENQRYQLRKHLRIRIATLFTFYAQTIQL